MENAEGTDRLRARDVALAIGLGILGISGIRWILHHPDEARKVDMAILLGTQKVSLRVSDGLRKAGDGARFVADKAGTQYNHIRSI
jgi:hypothetical protein